jgi:hypothetical protein
MIKSSNTVENIINLLGTEYPLSSKEIFNYLKKYGSSNISYQGVHKHIKQLLDEKILEKDKLKYKLNISWIKKEKDYFKYLENNYSGKKDFYTINLNFKKPLVLKFTNTRKLILFLVKILNDKKIIGNGPEIIISTSRHLYLPFNLNFNDFNTFKIMVKNSEKAYAISYNYSGLDKWIKTQYIKAGLDGVKIGIKDSLFDEGLFIHGDGIIEIKSSKKTKEVMDKIYNENNNIADLFKEIILKRSIKSELEFSVKIYQNPKIADLLRKQILNYFA